MVGRLMRHVPLGCRLSTAWVGCARDDRWGAGMSDVLFDQEGKQRRGTTLLVQCMKHDERPRRDWPSRYRLKRSSLPPREARDNMLLEPCGCCRWSKKLTNGMMLRLQRGVIGGWGPKYGSKARNEVQRRRANMGCPGIDFPFSIQRPRENAGGEGGAESQLRSFVPSVSHRS